jgi:hypothetical protein
MIPTSVSRPTVLDVDVERKKKRQELAEKSIESARELELESIESPTRMIKKLRPEEKSRLIPTRTQLGVIGKEIGIGIKKGFERVGEKAKKELYKTPIYLEKGTKKIGKYAVEKIKERLKEEAEFRRELEAIKRREKMGALTQKFRIEARERYIPKPTQQRTITQRMNIRLPILEKKERIPIFQPRQMKMTKEVALFKPNIAKLTPKLDITTLPKINRPMLKRERIRL